LVEQGLDTIGWVSIDFNDLNKIKSSFVKLLVAINHNRIKYPNQKDPDEEPKEDEKKKEEEKSEKIESEVKTEKNDKEKTEKKKAKKEVVLGDKTLDGVKLNG